MGPNRYHLFIFLNPRKHIFFWKYVVSSPPRIKRNQTLF